MCRPEFSSTHGHCVSQSSIHIPSSRSLSQGNVLSWDASASTLAFLETDPSEDPPTYQEARYPTHPITYTFAQVSSTSMVVVPPSDHVESRPLYHVSVLLNCFMPSGFRTVIRKGGSESGTVIAEFQIGFINIPAKLYFRGVESLLVEHLIRQERPRHGTWRWKHRDGKVLFWVLEHGGGVNRVCTFDPIRMTNPLAKLFPSDSLVRPGTQLEVFPDGQPLVDDIIVSALIIERQRLAPPEITKRGSNGGRLGLWNFRT